MLFKKRKTEYEQFKEWLENASIDELSDAYEEMRLKWIEDGCGAKPNRMEMINKVLSHKAAEQWRKEHPDAYTPGYRWTDKNRWE